MCVRVLVTWSVQCQSCYLTNWAFEDKPHQHRKSFQRCFPVFTPVQPVEGSVCMQPLVSHDCSSSDWDPSRHQARHEVTGPNTDTNNKQTPHRKVLNHWDAFYIFSSCKKSEISHTEMYLLVLQREGWSLQLQGGIYPHRQNTWMRGVWEWWGIIQSRSTEWYTSEQNSVSTDKMKAEKNSEEFYHHKDLNRVNHHYSKLAFRSLNYYYVLENVKLVIETLETE